MDKKLKYWLVFIIGGVVFVIGMLQFVEVLFGSEDYVFVEVNKEDILLNEVEVKGLNV